MKRCEADKRKRKNHHSKNEYARNFAKDLGLEANNARVYAERRARLVKAMVAPDDDVRSEDLIERFGACLYHETLRSLTKEQRKAYSDKLHSLGPVHISADFARAGVAGNFSQFFFGNGGQSDE